MFCPAPTDPRRLVLAVAVALVLLAPLCLIAPQPAEAAARQKGAPDVQRLGAIAIDTGADAADPVTAVIAAPSSADGAPPVSTPAPVAARVLVEVETGDTLGALLDGADVPREEAHEAIAALRTLFDPRTLQVGQEIAIGFVERGEHRTFVGLDIALDPARTLSVSRSDEGFTARDLRRPILSAPVAVTLDIESSLFEAGVAADVPHAVMAAIARVLAYGMDLQRDLQPGDRIDILYEVRQTIEGQMIGVGEPSLVRLTRGAGSQTAESQTAESQTYVHFAPTGRAAAWFDQTGQAVRRALLRTPIDGARLSSGFGRRRHPILGYTRMHRGVDFAAPTGTPVLAAGDGVIDIIGRKGAYGNYIRVRHDDRTATAYGHLSRYARGLRRGSSVRQGQVIGYVGSTGLSTGPHLHYEVLRGGVQVNPLSVTQTVGEALAAADRPAFVAHLEQLDRRFAELDAAVRLASTRELSGGKDQEGAVRPAGGTADCPATGC